MSDVPANLSGFVDSDLPKPRVLLIESDPADASAITQAINRYFDADLVTHSRSLSEALASNLDAVDLALSTMRADDADAIEIIEELLLVRPDLPVIMLDGGPEMSDAVVAIREGAYDYVVKHGAYLHALPVVLEKNLALHRVKQENARLQVQLTATLGQLRTRNQQLQDLVQELRTIAATDALTGIANRRAMTQALEQRFAHAARNNSEIAVIAADLDGFKQLNDYAGHPAGDRVLMLVARVLTANSRTSDLPGRVGGDEFIVVLPDTTAEEARSVARRIQDDFDLAYSELAKHLDYPGRVTASLGVATRRSSHAPTASHLLAAADRALYGAKATGKSCIVMDGAAI